MDIITDAVAAVALVVQGAERVVIAGCAVLNVTNLAGAVNASCRETLVRRITGNGRTNALSIGVADVVLSACIAIVAGLADLRDQWGTDILVAGEHADGVLAALALVGLGAGHQCSSQASVVHAAAMALAGARVQIVARGLAGAERGSRAASLCVAGARNLTCTSSARNIGTLARAALANIVDGANAKVVALLVVGSVGLLAIAVVVVAGANLAGRAGGACDRNRHADTVQAACRAFVSVGSAGRAVGLVLAGIGRIGSRACKKRQRRHEKHNCEEPLQGFGEKANKNLKWGKKKRKKKRVFSRGGR